MEWERRGRNSFQLLEEDSILRRAVSRNTQHGLSCPRIIRASEDDSKELAGWLAGDDASYEARRRGVRAEGGSGNTKTWAMSVVILTKHYFNMTRDVRSETLEVLITPSLPKILPFEPMIFASNGLNMNITKERFKPLTHPRLALPSSPDRCICMYVWYVSKYGIHHSALIPKRFMHRHVILSKARAIDQEEQLTTYNQLLQ
ncbi:hypothetical protein EYR41_000677 [Orbilia oligospora]|uniref:Uncharacterized protein n=1 Tax=Orbilia oligospora TaxID=2813651 RepID=A0A7C8PT93_ORBOL|nr:hypothetical protein TWF751_000844 [Orbilia oligospora]KAF3292969.1 hypothetical protein TWF132_004979 [Orbilia oligospora]TGJ73589.1 hypothetical protein EYR41_000677 [Orbilia oligospora]